MTESHTHSQPESHAGAEPALGANVRSQLRVAFFALLLIGANDGGLGILLPSIGAHYRVSAASLGALYIAVTIGYATVAFNSGLLMSQLQLRRLLLLGAACFLLGELLTSRMPPFPVVFVSSVVLGCGVACLDIGLNVFIAGLPGRTVRLNDLHAFYGTGALIGPLVASGVLAIGLLWSAVYIVWAVVACMLLVLLAATFRRPLQPEPQPPAASTTRERLDRNVLLAATRVPLLWIGAVFLTLYVGAEVSMGSWSFTFLTEARHGSLLLMGWVVSGYWAAFTLGRFTLARVTRQISELRLIQICLGGAFAGLLLTWLVPSTVGAAFGLWLTGLSFGPIYPTTIALLPRLVSSRAVASAIGVIASLGSIGGAVFPAAAGALLQALGPWVLPPFVLLVVLLMLAWWAILRAGSRAGFHHEPEPSALDTGS